MTAGAEGSGESAGTQRLDKWLWFARVVKTRSMAAALVTDGKVRVNRTRTDKPSHQVRSGDVITVTAHSRVRILKVVAPGTVRGSATIAQTLYEDLTPPPEPSNEAGSVPQSPQRAAGAGRPTKRDRRALDRLIKDES